MSSCTAPNPSGTAALDIATSSLLTSLVRLRNRFSVALFIRVIGRSLSRPGSATPRLHPIPTPAELDPMESEARKFLHELWVLQGVAYLVVALRYYSRIRINGWRHLAWDDLTMALAVVSDDSTPLPTIRRANRAVANTMRYSSWPTRASALSVSS